MNAIFKTACKSARVFFFMKHILSIILFLPLALNAMENQETQADALIDPAKMFNALSAPIPDMQQQSCALELWLNVFAEARDNNNETWRTGDGCIYCREYFKRNNAGIYVAKSSLHESVDTELYWKLDNVRANISIKKVTDDFVTLSYAVTHDSWSDASRPLSLLLKDREEYDLTLPTKSDHQKHTIAVCTGTGDVKYIALTIGISRNLERSRWRAFADRL